MEFGVIVRQERKLSGQRDFHLISIYCPDPLHAKEKLLHVDLYTIQSFLQQDYYMKGLHEGNADRLGSCEVGIAGIDRLTLSSERLAVKV